MRCLVQLVEYNGQSYTFSELSQLAGITEKALRYRIANGMSSEEAIAKGQTTRFAKYLFEGEMLSIPEIAARCGVGEWLIRNRLHRGLSLEDATSHVRGDAAATMRARYALVKSIEDITKGMPKAEADQYIAARKIATEIIPVTCLHEFNFRCTDYMREYTLNGDILSYYIRFTDDGKYARLTAVYNQHNAESTLNRLYKVTGSKIKYTPQDMPHVSKEEACRLMSSKSKSSKHSRPTT